MIRRVRQGVDSLRLARPLVLPALALVVVLLAVVSAWGVGAIDDFRIFGPAIFGGTGTQATPSATATATIAGQPSPTATATATATLPPSATATATATASPTATASSTATATATASATLTATPTATDTTTPTVTPTATDTASPTPTATATTAATATPTATATVKPTKTPKPTATATNTPAPGEELLVFDWNKPVTKDDHGFPWDKPPLANGDWTQPINFAQGTLYLRVQIFSQPVPQNMKLQFCFWQANNTLENCTHLVAVSGASGTVVTWSEAIKDLYKKDGQPLNWASPRTRNGVSVKNRNGDPVSDFSGMAWSGENPDEWYPLDMRFTVVVVEKGAGFSGWDNYIP